VTHYHLAQINIGRIRAPLDDPIMADFVNNLIRINTLGHNTPGFVWQLLTEEGDSTAFHVFEDQNILLNMTVWENVEALYDFTYRSHHVDFYRRRREWFEKFDGLYLVLWWVPAGHHPTPEEAKEKLAHLEAHGPTPLAFTFKQRFTVEEMLAANPTT
jgi:hypothetical protein